MYFLHTPRNDGLVYVPLTYRAAGNEYAVPTSLEATHSYLPLSDSSASRICNDPKIIFFKN